MNIKQLIHILIIIGFLCLALFPKNYMSVCRWLPLALLIVWLIFEKCPLTEVNTDGLLKV